MRVGFKIDSFAGDGAKDQAPACFGFLAACTTVFEDAKRCRKWRPAEAIAQGVEAEVFKHIINLPVDAVNLRELVKTIDGYQQAATESKEILVALKGKAEAASPPERKAIQEADSRLSDLDRLLESINSWKTSVKELQEGESISLGRFVLHSPDPKEKTEGNLDLLVVIPQFSN